MRIYVNDVQQTATQSSGSKTLLPSTTGATQTSSTASASVSLSTDATLRSKAATLYNAYFPTRAGFSSDALSVSTALPQSNTSSIGLEGDTLAKNVRQRLNSTYSAMAATGTPYAYDSADNVDNNTLFGQLDRTSLEAVVSDQSSLFTDGEKTAAQRIMDQQYSLASGVYSGPDSQASTFTTVSDPQQQQAQAAKFLDNVSDAEKLSNVWVLNRARLMAEASQA